LEEKCHNMMEDTKDTKCLNILEQTMFWKVLTKSYRRTMTKDSMTLKEFEAIYVCVCVNNYLM
jgi:hypothetical protein